MRQDPVVYVEIVIGDRAVTVTASRTHYSATASTAGRARFTAQLVGPVPADLLALRGAHREAATIRVDGEPLASLANPEVLATHDPGTLLVQGRPVRRSRRP